MITLSLEASRLVEPVRVANLYGVVHNRKRLVVEARGAVTNKHLNAYREESRRLVETLESSLLADLQRVAAFEAAVPELERAIIAERQASDDLARARQAHAQGSLDRKEQLRRRDDVEAAFGALTVRTAERIAAVSAVGYLPQNDGVAEGDRRIREMVQTIAMKAENAKFRSEITAPLDENVWSNWLDKVSDNDMLWIPIFAARLIAQAGPEFDSSHRELITLPRTEFSEALARFKAERERRKAAKLAAAQALVESAMKERIMLEGAA
jgi:hypothetical protein